MMARYQWELYVPDQYVTDRLGAEYKYLSLMGTMTYFFSNISIDRVHFSTPSMRLLGVIRSHLSAERDVTHLMSSPLSIFLLRRS